MPDTYEYDAAQIAHHVATLQQLATLHIQGEDVARLVRKHRRELVMLGVDDIAVYAYMRHNVQ